MSSSVLIVGADGQLGTALQRTAPTWAAPIPVSHADCEITDPDSVEACLARHRPKFVINTAAYNKVDAAETESDAAMRINRDGPFTLQRGCNLVAARLVHVSTDYVFDSDPATAKPLTELDAVNPGSMYARSKLAGEDVWKQSPTTLVVRTCGLYGPARSTAKSNFVKTMLRLGRERGTVRVVADQHCTPSYAIDVAAAIWLLLEREASGLFHCTNSGATTWAGFAAEIFRVHNVSASVTPITTAEFGAAAKRPRYSVLDCSKLAGMIGRAMSDFRDALRRYNPDE
jgi:dTDP-4-dehydrorhamnose reductase